MKPTDSLKSWLDYLESTRLHLLTNAQEGVVDLQHARKIIEKLQLNPMPCPVITVTGTNGKGSCIAVMESVLLASGYRSAALTSPHLLHFAERLRINGKNIADKKLCEAFCVVLEIEKQNNFQLSFYRFIHTAMLYLCFYEKLDIMLLEVGLGGRSDSINLIDPNVAVVTSVDLDHCNILGNTRELIAREKAGIFRANISVVSGEEEGEYLLKPFADKLNCHFSQVGKTFKMIQHEHAWDYQDESLQLKGLPYPTVLLKNAAVALQALFLLPDAFVFKKNAIVQGLKNIQILGRQEYINPAAPCLSPCLLDVAHNPASTQLLIEKVDELSVRGKKHAIFSVMQDKDLKEMLKLMLPAVDFWYIPQMSAVRARKASEIVAILHEHGQQAKVFSSVGEAYDAVKQVAKVDDLILALGSFKVIAAMYKELR